MPLNSASNSSPLPSNSKTKIGLGIFFFLVVLGLLLYFFVFKKNKCPEQGDFVCAEPWETAECSSNTNYTWTCTGDPKCVPHDVAPADQTPCAGDEVSVCDASTGYYWSCIDSTHPCAITTEQKTEKNNNCKKNSGDQSIAVCDSGGNWSCVEPPSGCGEYPDVKSFCTEFDNLNFETPVTCDGQGGGHWRCNYACPTTEPPDCPDGQTRPSCNRHSSFQIPDCISKDDQPELCGAAEQITCTADHDLTEPHCTGTAGQERYWTCNSLDKDEYIYEHTLNSLTMPEFGVDNKNVEYVFIDSDGETAAAPLFGWGCQNKGSTNNGRHGFPIDINNLLGNPKGNVFKDADGNLTFIPERFRPWSDAYNKKSPQVIYSGTKESPCVKSIDPGCKNGSTYVQNSTDPFKFGFCDCKPGYGGDKCQYEGFTSAKYCNNHGVPPKNTEVDPNGSQGDCDCENGWFNGGGLTVDGRKMPIESERKGGSTNQCLVTTNKKCNLNWIVESFGFGGEQSDCLNFTNDSVPTDFTCPHLVPDADTCHGYSCDIEDQFCPEGNPGADGKSFICRDSEWVEVDSRPESTQCVSHNNCSPAITNNLKNWTGGQGQGWSRDKNLMITSDDDALICQGN